MKKIFNFGILMFLLFLAGNNCLAQEQASSASKKTEVELTIIAQVDIFNANLISQDGNNFKIGFDLRNSGGVQPEVRYGITLVEEKDKKQYIVDQKTYDEILSLKPGETLKKEIQYSAPKYLQGKYALYIDAKNSDGLPFSSVPIKSVTLNGDGQYIKVLTDSCYLTINSNEKEIKYPLRQGIGISSEDGITLHCDAQNNFKKDIKAIPNFDVYYRSVFGEIVGHENQPEISFAAGKKTTLNLPLAKAKDPQAYDVVLTLKDSLGAVISNSVNSHYVLRGASATIENLLLDKENYQAGETAKLSFFWSGSADNFNTGAEKTNIGDIKINIGIESNGTQCIKPFEGQLNENEGIKKEYSLAVTNNCGNPQVWVQLTDASGKVLAEKGFNMTGGKFSIAEQKKENKPAFDLVEFLKYVIGAVILLAAIVVIYMAIKKKSGGNYKNLTLLLVILLSGIFLAHGAQAVTFGIHIDRPAGNIGGTDVIFNAQLDKAVYTPGETQTAYGSAISTDCNNTLAFGGLSLLNRYIVGGPGGTPFEGGVMHSGATSLPAPSSAGNYTADFVGEVMFIWADYDHDQFMDTCNGNNWHWGIINGAWSWHDCGWGPEWLPKMQFAAAGFPFVVVNPPAASISANPNPIAYNNASTVSWSSNVNNNCWVWDDAQTIINGWAGTSGSFSTGALTAARGFHAQCYDSAWNAAPQADVTVGVNACPADSACSSHTVTWGVCSASCGGGTATQTGTCDNGCGGSGSASRTCTNNVPCCSCSASENATQCAGAYTNSCGISCTGTKDCSQKGWKEVSP